MCKPAGSCHSPGSSRHSWFGDGRLSSHSFLGWCWPWCSCIPSGLRAFIHILLNKILLWKEMEKEMATHSSILAWRIPWTEEPGGLQSMGSQKVRHDWVTNTWKRKKVYSVFFLYCTYQNLYLPIYLIVYCLGNMIPILWGKIYVHRKGKNQKKYRVMICFAFFLEFFCVFPK